MRRLYVAYGSNLNLKQMALRCPTATVYGKGYLDNWKLIYRGSPTNAYATIERSEGNGVPVVIWDIGKIDEYYLDRYEGYPVFYFKETVSVTMPDRQVAAMVYIMDTRKMAGKPSKTYIETIRTGYKENGLEMAYLNESLKFNITEIQKGV